MAIPFRTAKFNIFEMALIPANISGYTVCYISIHNLLLLSYYGHDCIATLLPKDTAIRFIVSHFIRSLRHAGGLFTEQCMGQA